MHLPSNLYERAPHYWLFIGLLLVVVGIYLGVEIDTKFMFVGVALGIASCLWGVRVFLYRARKPGEADVATSTSTAD